MFTVHKIDWLRRFPMDPENPVAGGSWIRTRETSAGEFFVGCRICSEAGKGKAFGQMMVHKNLASARFNNHEKSADHQAAQALLRGTATRSQLELQKAPSQEHFEKVLRGTWSGTANGDGVAMEVGKRKKSGR